MTSTISYKVYNTIECTNIDERFINIECIQENLLKGAKYDIRLLNSTRLYAGILYDSRENVSSCCVSLHLALEIILFAYKMHKGNCKIMMHSRLSTN